MYIYRLNIPFLSGLNMATKSNQPSVIHSMITGKLLKAPAFSLYLKGGKTSKNGGEITFGGHNDKLINFKIPGVNTAILGSGGGQPVIKMTSLTFGKESICDKKQATCTVLMDSGCSSIQSSEAITDDIYKIIGMLVENVLSLS